MFAACKCSLLPRKWATRGPGRSVQESRTRVEAGRFLRTVPLGAGAAPRHVRTRAAAAAAVNRPPAGEALLRGGRRVGGAHLTVGAAHSSSAQVQLLRFETEPAPELGSGSSSVC